MTLWEVIVDNTTGVKKKEARGTSTFLLSPVQRRQHQDSLELIWGGKTNIVKRTPPSRAAFDKVDENEYISSSNVEH